MDRRQAIKTGAIFTAGLVAPVAVAEAATTEPTKPETVNSNNTPGRVQCYSQKRYSINPEHVCYIESLGDKKTVIHFTGSHSIIVSMSYDKVLQEVGGWRGRFDNFLEIEEKNDG